MCSGHMEMRINGTCLNLFKVSIENVFLSIMYACVCGTFLHNKIFL